jgi:hypothetical protein
MKTKIIILIVCILCKIQFAKANTEQLNDSINIDNAIAVRIEQNIDNQSKYKYTANLFIHNLLLDTIGIISDFTLDYPRLSYILVYSCQYVNDSIICDYDWPIPGGKQPPLTIDHWGRASFIAPKHTKSFEIPVRGDYEETEVFFKVRIVVFFQGQTHFFEKETNRIFLNKIEKTNDE